MTSVGWNCVCLRLHLSQGSQVLDRVGIIGLGQTRCERSKKEIFFEASFEAATRALEDAGIERGDLDNIVLAGYDLAVGRTISNMYTAPAAGGYLKDEIRVSDDGLYALALALMRVRAGFDITMVLAYGICSEAPMEYISNLICDPFYYRPIGLCGVSSHALQASAYINRYGIDRRDADRVIKKNRSNAIKNPNAMIRSEAPARQLASPKYLSWPLREVDVAPKGDATVALIIASETTATRLCDNPVWVTGIGWNNDTYYMGDKDLTRLNSTHFAAGRAYAMAGVKDPVGTLDLAEIYDVTSYQELMLYEALGFCGRGEGPALAKSRTTSRKGDLPVNTSGGSLSGDPVGASGLAKVAEIVLQLWDKADGRQVKDARTGLAQASVGLGHQGSCVAVLQV